MPGPAVSEVGSKPLIALRTIRSTVAPTNCLIASSQQWAVATLSSLSISPHPLPRGVVVAQEHTLPSNIHARKPYSHRTRPPAALIRSRSAPTGQIRRRHSPSVTRMGYRGGEIHVPGVDAALLVLLVGVLVLLDAGLDAAPSASCVQRKRASHRRYRLMGFYRVDAAFGELRPAKVGLHPARFGTVVDFGRSSTPTIQARQK